MPAGFRQGDQALMIDGVAVTASAAQLNDAASGTQAAAIPNVATAGSATAAANATAINAILVALREFGVIAES
jgi:hypothetical protein